MRQVLLIASLSGSLASVGASTPDSLPPLRRQTLEVPGYELRTLDVQKSVLFQVGGSQVEIAVPVFLYYPTANAPTAARLLRDAQSALLKLSAKPEWTAAELQQVIAGLDEGARRLEAVAPPSHSPSVAAK